MASHNYVQAIRGMLDAQRARGDCQAMYETACDILDALACAHDDLGTLTQAKPRESEPKCWCGMTREKHVNADRDFRPRGR